MDAKKQEVSAQARANEVTQVVELVEVQYAGSNTEVDEAWMATEDGQQALREATVFSEAVREMTTHEVLDEEMRQLIYTTPMPVYRAMVALYDSHAAVFNQMRNYASQARRLRKENEELKNKVGG